jgi:hypothetical protein
VLERQLADQQLSEFLIAIKNKILSFAGKWMESVNIMLMK